MSDRSILEIPAPDQRADFAPDFGQRSLLTVDTEEEFDWGGDFHAHNYGLEHLRRLGRFQEFAEHLGVSPVYLIDWPIANSKIAADILGDAVQRGKAEIGVQLHPWVNPPHDETVNARNSYAGNLPPVLERDKFCRLRDAIAKNFGIQPQIYRAGRYGLGPHSAQMLREEGIAIDSSVRANFDYSDGFGPDYSQHPLEPYWVDEQRRLLELPLTTVYWGMLRRQGKWLHPLSRKVPRLSGLLSRTAVLEKIALTPEGVSVEEAIRGIDIAVDDGLPLLVLSFHSPSLMPGKTPYVQNEDDLDALYEWLRRVYAYLGTLGVRPTSVAEVMEKVTLE